MARRSKRRWYRKLFRWLAGFVLGILALIVLIYALLQTPPGREIVRGIAEDLANDALLGTLQVGEITRITLSGARVRDAALLDPSGRTVLEVGEVDVDIDLASLIGGEIAIDEVVVRDPRVVLVPGPDGQPTLLQAIAAENPQPEPPPDPNAEPTRVRVSRIEVTGGVVDSEYSDAPDAALENIALLASARTAEYVDVLVDSFTFDVTESGDALMRLEPFTARFSNAPGERSRAHLTLAGSGSRIDLFAWVGGLGEGEKPSGDVVLTMAPLDTAILDRLGLSDLRAQVPEWLRGRIHVSGNQAVADLKLVMDSPGGPFDLRAHVENMERVEATLRTPGLTLNELSGAMPAMHVEAGVGIVAAPAGAGERWILLSLRDAALDDTILPDLDLVSRLGADYIEVDDLALPELDMEQVLVGRIGFTGDVDVAVDIPPVDLATVPALADLGAEGRVEVELTAEVGPSDWPNLHWHGNISAEGFRYGDLRADRLAVAGQAHGALPAPEVNLDVSARNLIAGTTGVEEAELHVVGGAEDYDMTGHVGLLDGTYAEADLSARWLEEFLQVSGQVFVTYQGENFEAELRQVEFEPNVAVRAQLVELSYGTAWVEAGGEWRLDEAEGSFEAAFDDIDLATLGGRLGIPELPVAGIVSGGLVFRGDMEDPNINAEVDWRDGTASGVHGIEAAFDLAYGRQEMTLDLLVTAPDLGEIVVTGAGAFNDPAPPQDALMSAYWDIELTGDLPDLERVAAMLPEGSPPLSGAVALRAQLAGTLAAPEGRLDLDGEALRLQPLANLVDAELHLDYDGRELHIEALAEDLIGQLAGLNATAAVTRADLEAPDAVERLLGGDWQVELWVPERNLSDFGVRDVQDAPLLVAVEAAMANADGRGPGGQLRLSVRSPLGDGEEAERDDEEVTLQVVGREDDAGCELLPGDVTELALFFDAESTRLEVQTGDYGAPELEATLQLPAAWIERIAPGADSDVLEADIIIDELRLDRLPVACRYASGNVGGQVRLTGALGDEPAVTAELWGESVAWGDAIPFDLEVRARNLEGYMVTELAILPAAAEDAAGQPADGDGSDGGQANIAVSVPIRWSADDIAPQIEGGVIQARLEFTDFAVAPLSPMVSMLRGEGRINGQLVFMGATPEELVPTGEIILEDLALTIPGVDQRLQDTSGTIRFEEGTIVLEDLSAEDRDGKVELSGTIALDGIMPQTVELTVSADEFPMRQAGIVAAWMTTDATINADLGGEEIVADVELRDLAIRLPEQIPRRVLSLERNPDVVYEDELLYSVAADLATRYHSRIGPWSVRPAMDEEVVAEATEEATQDEGPAGDETPPPPDHTTARPREGGDVPPVAAGDQSEEVVEGQPGAPAEEAIEDRTQTIPGEPATRTVRLTLDATEPFWVRRTDFSVQLTADLDLVATGEGARISGPVEIRRGFIDLFGRTFNFEGGEIVFTGGRELDALLDLEAVHELDRYPGETVTVSISGRLAEPEMVLATTLEDVTSEAEIAQLLLTGRVSSSSGEPVGAENQVASFLGGLTAGLLTMTARRELGDAVPLISVQAGDSLDDVQVRAGFVADRLVPDFLEGVVQGAYVEGFVGRESIEGGTAQTGETGAGASRTTGGFLIELYFPYGLVSITSFEPPASWSQDIRWQP